jgi:hypothetical protein
MDIRKREELLHKRLEHIKELEEEILKREAALKSKDTARKQIVLRLSPALWDKIAAWAEDDFRSVNSQIEYLLNEAVKGRSNKKRPL